MKIRSCSVLSFLNQEIGNLFAEMAIKKKKIFVFVFFLLEIIVKKKLLIDDHRWEENRGPIFSQ